MPDERPPSLESRLAALAAELDRMPTPDVASAVGHRLRGDRRMGAPRRAVSPARVARQRPVRRGLAVGLAALALGATTALAASPELRDDLLELIGVRGVRIEQVPELPSVPPQARDELGERVSLAEADRRVAFELRRIERPAFRKPDRVHLRRLDGTSVVSFGFAPRRSLPRSPHTDAGLLVTQFRARVDEPVLRKLAVGGRVERVRVSGAGGYWLAGGEHVITYRAGGKTLVARRAGNVLVWQDGSVTLRVEAQVPKRRALRIARSVG